MELQQLRYFVAVAETEHVARAAERLHISQSPLSRQIRQLESHLGLQLFERVRQRVRLTPAGKDFLVQARELLAQAARLEERARQVGKGEMCTVSIGYCEGVIHNGRLPAALRRFRAAYPHVKLKLAAMRSGEQADALERSVIDVAFVYNLPPPRSASFSSQLLSREPFVLALAHDHRLAQRREILPEELDGEPWIALPKSINPAARERFLAACAASGFAPDIQFEVAQVSTTLGLVSAGLGAAVMQASMRRMHPPGVVFKSLDWLPLAVETHVLWRSNAQPAGVRRFLEVLEQGESERDAHPPPADEPVLAR
ncbi:LysR substrate-binding domain-containing protein [Trinickia caryophylli]|uniref:DNA-binding transcriptional regulator, LysR family n=1 Tax=Trinickia caryophylli TaxID=28094 RepID=A0A1X7CDW4_TRICW|nr:LysR substrate-binding domain-containing protein [Trinickia caryophylli]PMS12572.1 LysR family transcriptional regulator [Trinickia caryophylli]TRX19777.1 LysR family transcriptional regulator [Trinickia caryophylli]WQE12898.1 LysR substrate-binding domain-containing protein [Trinickia caryophylli]SME95036.1 DNA-binding transcriptional regulator, LysR family [Trinickia caryophylli]GLU30624.1 LysR family transcriptional regulator [Trinickia caryophylli]